jgi:2-succinyl-5-enolpyruvyl-6-hydroxy-3-cyclohexene-1-carboxylate synthase
MNNGKWAHALIDQLIQQGVVDFCIAPGSRSTPLALACARHPKAILTVHFDERGLGFFALGKSLASHRPTALIVTSGTGVGNLLPAVMEAHHSHVPLILLTADRPAELRDVNANQTTDQIKIFQNFVRWQTDLPCPDSLTTEAYIRSQGVHAVFHALEGGPVHLNCQFREPLFELPLPYSEGTLQPLFLPTLTPSVEALEHVRRAIAGKRGLILVGRLPYDSDLSPIIDLSERLGSPLFADFLSQAQRHTPSTLIRNFDYAIRTQEVPSPEYILYFGGRFTSKALPEWVHAQGVEVLHVHSHHERIDPFHSRPTRLVADPLLFCELLQIDSCDKSYLQEWQVIDQVIAKNLETVFQELHPFTEADLMRALGKTLPGEWSLFLANSMPIRDAEHFFLKNDIHVFANRGLSGIDGQIATAAGIAMELKKPLVAVIGDQSTLHDLNSLSLLKEIKTPFLLVISNNFGGGIFSHLPVQGEPEHFETLWGRDHNLRFKEIASFFGMPYYTDLQHVLEISGPVILEIFTSRKENVCFQKRILEQCSRKETKNHVGATCT